jgi:hypothetical protein
MSREIITKSGAVAYRTKLFRDDAQAARFARCLNANSRFRDVAIVENVRAGSGSYITFRPVNEERQKDLYMNQHTARLIRGYEQMANYLFVQDSDQVGLWWCYNLVNEEVYQVTAFDCTCPDYQFRCRRAGLQCKHQHARQAQADNGLLGQTCPLVDAQERLNRAVDIAA